MARDYALEVDQGALTEDQARRYLRSAAIQKKLKRELGHFDPEEFAKGLWWTLETRLARYEQARMEACDAVRQAVAPLFRSDATKDEIDEAAIKANDDRLSDEVLTAILWQERMEFNRRSRWQG